MIRLKNMPHMLWIAGLALIAACSDGGGEERPGPQQTALSIVWTPEAPAAGQSVRFSLGGDVSNVRSVELGCVEFIETDVQITKDGEVICLHDNYLSRFTDYNDYASGKGLVADFTLEELGRFRLKTTDGKVSDQKIPTLEEVLMEFRGKVWFNLDKCMESDVSIEKVYDVVERCGCLDRVQFYISDDTDRADWLSRQKPQGIIAPHANKEEVLTRMAAYSPVYMFQTSTQYAGASWISSINARALSVTNLLDDEGQAFYNGNTTVMDGFVSAGVRMIQCDYPAEMDEYLRGRGKR